MNYMKVGNFIIRKIFKISATRCHMLRLKCTKFDFGWRSAPDPAGEAYSAPPGPLTQDPAGGAYSAPPAGFKGPYF